MVETNQTIARVLMMGQCRRDVYRRAVCSLALAGMLSACSSYENMSPTAGGSTAGEGGSGGGGGSPAGGGSNPPPSGGTGAIGAGGAGGSSAGGAGTGGARIDGGVGTGGGSTDGGSGTGGARTDGGPGVEGGNAEGGPGSGGGSTDGASGAGGGGTEGGSGTGGSRPEGGVDVGSMDGSRPAGCEMTVPAIADYGAYGPFMPTTVNATGPNGQYTLIRPQTLGENGFKHPPVTWGNGITTTPALYPGLLNTIASHGFVIIASNSTSVNAQLMTAGLDWLIAQNTASGDFQGKLSPTCAVSIGYSLGGGGAVDTGKHASVVTTVSFHGLQGTAESLHGPLLLITGTADNFVSAAGYVTPTFNRSMVQTFYGTLTGADHLKPLGDAGEERAPAVAWLRLWVYGDNEARKFFYGDDCLLCKAPWTNPQRKNWR
jgi:hypothetical protein